MQTRIPTLSVDKLFPRLDLLAILRLIFKTRDPLPGLVRLLSGIPIYYRLIQRQRAIKESHFSTRATVKRFS